MDRLNSMRVFTQVIEQGSFAGAARELNLSPAVVTRLIADLEEHLGARLINRTTRRLALTDTGELYLERVRHILTEIEDAEMLTKVASTEPRGHLRVLCSAAFAVHQLAKHLPRFRALCPRVTLELSAPGPVEAVDENFDVSILTEGRRSLGANSTARRLARSEVIACAAPGYLARRGWPEHPRDLASHETLGASVPGELIFHRGAGLDRRAGAPSGDSFTVRTPDPALSTVHTETMLACALAGLGIAGLPSFVAEDALREHALERVLPQWHLLTTTVYAGMPTRQHVPARTRVFVDFLVKTFGAAEHDPWLVAAGCETQPAEAEASPQAALALTR